MYARKQKPAAMTANRITERCKVHTFCLSRELLLLGSLLALLLSSGAGAG
jgi:hypothetical protein